MPEQKAFILFDTKEPPEEMKRKGFTRAWKDGEMAELGPGLQVDGNLTMVLDRLIIKDEPRLSDSIETAWREGKGSMRVL